MSSAAEQEHARMAAFHELKRDEQAAVIRRMSDGGSSVYLIASATQLSVEFVRQILGERGDDE